MVYGANKNKNLVINNYHRSIFKIVYNILLLSVTTTLIYELSCSILLQKVNQKEHSIHSISKKLLRGTRSPHSLGGGGGWPWSSFGRPLQCWGQRFPNTVALPNTINMATNDGKNVSTTHFLEFKITLHCFL
jgi:hypothetical protein